MNKILSLLWDETLDNIKMSDEYENRYAHKEEAYKKLSERLNNEEKKLLTEYANMATHKECTANEIFFIAGVKAGVRLIMDCLSDE